MQIIKTQNPQQVALEHLGNSFVHIVYSSDYNNPFHEVIILKPSEFVLSFEEYLKIKK